jgi:hypothetical protein
MICFSTVILLLQCVFFIVSLITAAVMECPGRLRLSIRLSYLIGNKMKERPRILHDLTKIYPFEITAERRDFLMRVAKPKVWGPPFCVYIRHYRLSEHTKTTQQTSVAIFFV